MEINSYILHSEENIESLVEAREELDELRSTSDRLRQEVSPVKESSFKVHLNYKITYNLWFYILVRTAPCTFNP